LPGDQLVLCSDGIPDYAGVDEEDAEDNILRCVESALTVHHAAFELITLANKGGGGDNLSCIVLKFGESLEAMRGE
jgi:serine/threonine protein phosphatase PrpC